MTPGHLLLPLFALAGCGVKQAQCDEFVDELVECYDDLCTTSDFPVCECWNRGMDLDLGSCECIELQIELVCEVVDLPAEVDCPTLQDAVQNIC